MNELDLIRAIGGPAAEHEPSDHARETALARLQAAMAEETATGIAIVPLRHRGPARKGRLLASIAVAAALLLLASIVLPIGPGGPARVAAGELQRLADVAALQPSGAIGDGGVLYERRSGTTLHAGEILGSGLEWSVLIPFRSERWSAPDGSGRFVERYGEPVFATEADRERWIEAGSIPLDAPGTRDERYGPGESRYEDLTDLPTDPQAILDVLSQRSGEQADDDALDHLDVLAELLSVSEVSAKGRAALFEAATLIPGIRYLGPTEDHAGRTGVGFIAERPGRSLTLVFDPATSSLLEEQRVHSGAETWWTVLETGVVAEIGDRPAS